MMGSNPSMNIFTYGSLMFGAVWRPLVTGQYASMSACLDGYIRQGVRGTSYPGIMVSPGAQTPGRLYLDVSAADVARLDAFEGDQFRRERVVVRIDRRTGSPVTLDAQAYVLVDPKELDGSPWDVERFAQEFASDFYRLHAGAPLREAR